MTIRPIRPLATLTILMLCAVTTLQAQQQTFPTDYFKHPLQLPVSLAGDFAEIRPNHFHSGIDLRTGGKEGEKVYIQVSDDISREDTFKREVSSLLGIKDAYPKLLIARTKHDESQHEGIRIIDIARWLSDSQK